MTSRGEAGSRLRKKVLVTQTAVAEILPALYARLATDFDVVGYSSETIRREIVDAFAIVPGRDPIHGELVALAGECALIQQFGAGLDAIDLAAAREHGILVANVPTEVSLNAESIAELVVFFLIGLARDYRIVERDIRAGTFASQPGRLLRELRVGLLGIGGVGEAIVAILRAFHCRISAATRSPSEERRERLGLESLWSLQEKRELFAWSDVLIVALPLADESREIISVDDLDAFRPGSYLVNIARGGLVQRAAILEGLHRGIFAGVGLDVFWDEPPAPDDEVFDLNVFATPHFGGLTFSMISETADIVASNIRLAAGGELPRHLVVGG